MRKNNYLVAALFLLLPLIVLSCSTSQDSVMTADMNRQESADSAKGAAGSFGYLNYDALVATFTTRNNPYASYKTGTLIIIDVEVQSEDPVELRVSEAELSTDEGTRNAVPKQEVYDYWNGIVSKRYDGRPSSPSGAHKGLSKTVLERIDDTMLGDSVSIPASGSLQGFIAFDPINAENKGKRRGGTGTMTLPVYGADGSLLHEFTYQFTIN
jgi:hypothetical protein